MRAPFFYLEQIQKRINELKYLRYRDIVNIDSFKKANGQDDLINPSIPNYDSEQLSKNEYWIGRDTYIWLNSQIIFPQSFKGKKVVGYFDFGKTGIGNNSQFESMVYINKKPYQGVDTNHKEVFFDIDELGEACRLDFRLWSGLEGGGEIQLQYHQFREAFIAVLDEACDSLYYLAKNIGETIEVLDDSDLYKHQLQKILVNAFQFLDFTNHRSDEFYLSVEKANNYLEDQLKKMDGKSPHKVICTGHTHIDVAWLWRLKHTREKISRSFSTVLRLMEQYDEYHFLQTQAQLYEYIQKDFPEIYAQIKGKVNEGKWEPSGSMWVEADCNLTSGESIVRQILYGKRFFEKEFGYRNTFLWLPDVFGYTWAMPQILKKSGIDTFITTKISWNEVNRMPNDTFIWRGLDGSEVLTHFVTTPDVDGDTKFYTYNGNILPKIVKGVWENYRNKDLNDTMLVSYGYGDGGGGVNRDMLENRRVIDSLPSMASTKTGSVTNYLEGLHKTISESNDRYLHTWDNELYLEFHRGTYTSQAYNKLMNRKMELSYRNAEILSVFGMVKNENDTDDRLWKMLNEGWKIILRNQFHDIIPGSSIHEVYEDSKIEYEDVQNIVNNVEKEALQHLVTKKDSTFTVFNTAGWKRQGLVTLKGLENLDLEDKVIVDGSNKQLSYQKEDKNIVVFMDNMEPLSMETVSIKNRNEILDSYIADENLLETVSFEKVDNLLSTPHYEIKWNKYGQLTSIIDKKTSREVLTGIGNELQIFEDKPREYDAWELESTIDMKKEIIDDFKGVKEVSNGPLMASYEFSWKYNKTHIIQTLIVYKNSKRIDFKTTVHWEERDKVLKVAFPVDVRSTEARYDIQFGNVTRPTHRSTSWDMAKFEVVGHQWADLSEKGFGVSLLNDCKYGYDIKDNVMRLTLLKSPSFPDPVADRGRQVFTYSLYVHEEIWYESKLIHEAWDLNDSLKCFSGKVKKPQSFVRLDGDSVCLDAMKKAEDSEAIVLRFHEMYGGKAVLKLDFDMDIQACYICDLMEENETLITNESSFELEFRPYELKTIMIK